MDTQYEAVTWGMMELLVFGRATGSLSDALIAKARTQVAALNTWAEAQLGDAQWFNGTAFGWGDIAVAPFLIGAVGFGAPPGSGQQTCRMAGTLPRPTIGGADNDGGRGSRQNRCRSCTIDACVGRFQTRISRPSAGMDAAIGWHPSRYRWPRRRLHTFFK